MNTGTEEVKIKLKLCPFCGRMPTLKASKGTARIVCECGASLRYWDGETTDQARDVVSMAWNRRSWLKVTVGRIKKFFRFLCGW